MPNPRFSPSDAERVASDPGLLVEFVEHYTGVHDPLDALWWMTHPNDPAPSGRHSPLNELKPLEAVVYGVPSPATAAATEQLRRLVQTIESERAATRAALAASLAAESRAIARATEQADSTHPEQPHPEPSQREARVQITRRRFYRATVLTSVAVIAALIGVLAGGFVGNQREAPAVDTTGALAIFDEPQVVADVPPNALNQPQFDVLSFRALVDSPPVYVARAASGQDVCLVLVQPEGKMAASCVDAESFPESGLTIRGSYENPGTVQADDPDTGTFLLVDVTWLPDGNFYSRSG